MVPFLLIAFVGLGLGKVALDSFELERLREEEELDQENMAVIRKVKRHSAHRTMEKQSKPEYLILKEESLYERDRDAFENDEILRLVKDSLEQQKRVQKLERKKKKKEKFRQDLLKTVSILTCKASVEYPVDLEEAQADNHVNHSQILIEEEQTLKEVSPEMIEEYLQESNVNHFHILIEEEQTLKEASPEMNEEYLQDSNPVEQSKIENYKPQQNDNNIMVTGDDSDPVTAKRSKEDEWCDSDW
eukprot:CAMPEP_0117740478 /NCGR_PEP_ID=MMETSP0947-20121206/4367_1 /TAXON_ID=44440 /ORGANISM="Chattonella subsalsa, Strain CCMP2191" /LENGTH=244 /DNA_ID=CAMNT_0005556603 /DNA_START=104 /DNA_END=835 /DNA_ORIENTATION=-